jgi:putative endonuclease
MSTWYMYVVKCADETLYTGITTDVSRRVHEHNHSAQGARYTRARRPVELVGVWAYADRSEAASSEYAFKDLDRSEKVEMLRDDRVFQGAEPVEDLTEV